MFKRFILLLLALSVSGLHHNGQRGSFKGKLKPTIQRIKESIATKVATLKSELSHHSGNTSTTTRAPEGVDILADWEDKISAETKSFFTRVTEWFKGSH